MYDEDSEKRKGIVKLNLETVTMKDEIAKCEDVDEVKGIILPMIKT